MGKGKKFLLYVLYTTIAFVFFMYWFFPSDAVKRYVKNRVSQDPSVSVDFAEISPAIPFSLILRQMDIHYNGVQVLQFPQVKVSPRIKSLFAKEKIVDFKGKLFDGIVKGFSKTAKDGSTRLAETEVHLTDIRIENISEINRFEKIKLSGRLDGAIVLNEMSRQGSDLKADISVSQGQARINPPLIGVDQIDIDRIEADIQFVRNRIRLKSCSLKGPQFDGKMTGMIELNKSLGKSRLNFSGTIKPHPDFIAKIQSQIPEGMINSNNLAKRGQPFKIRGTFEDPIYSMK